ncbi:MAG TPA: glycosyltransferase family 39 protein [Methylomirabilota bacterium]|nr:glycosyltransferase family 39 protein [Methylomirabilota bacterium]
MCTARAKPRAPEARAQAVVASPLSRAAWLALAAILAASAAVRFVALGAEDLWLDEARTVAVAQHEWLDLVGALAQDNKPPLYYAAVHAWLRGFGESEAALRSLSALFGVLTVALCFAFGRDLLGTRGAIVAAMLVGLTPVAVHYSREGRNYAMLMFFVLLTTWSLHRALTLAADWRRWALYAAALLASVATHYAGALVLLVGLVQVCLRPSRERWKAWAVSVGAVAVAFSPWLLVLRRQVEGIGSTLSWLVPFWETYPPPVAIPLSLRAFLPGGAVPPFVGMPTLPALQPWLVLGGLALAAILAWPGRTDWLHPVRGTARAELLAYLFLPLAVPFAVSFVKPVYMVGRSDVLVLPAFSLLLALAVGRLRSTAAQSVVAAALLAACIAGLAHYFANPQRTLERESFRTLAVEARDGDLLVCTDLTRPTAEYYLRRLAPGVQVEFLSYPADMAKHPATIDRNAYRARGEQLDRDADAILTRVRRASAEERRVVILNVSSGVTDPLRRALSREFVLVRHSSMPAYRLNRVLLPVEVLVPRRR